MQDSPLKLCHWLAAAALLAIAGCSPPPQKMPPRPPPPVTVITATSRDVPDYIDEIGRTTPFELVNIQPQVTGQVMARHFVDGTDLKKGQPLFDIDPRSYQAMVEQAQANLEQAQAQRQLAEAELARYQVAAKVNAATREDLDTKQAALNTAVAQVKVNQAALDTAKLNLSYCKIAAPIEGRAGQRLVDVGNIVKANDTMMLTIQRLAPIYVDFTVTERDLPTVRNRMASHELKVLVSMPESPENVHEAALSFLDTAVQPNAGRINLRATLPNRDRYFWAGQFVNVRLVLDQIKGAVLIPYGCTQMGQKGPYVYIVGADNKAQQQQVTLGQRQGGSDDFVVILTGVKAGEQVVRTGQLSVNPGGEVRIVPPVTAPGATGTAPGAAEPAGPESAPATQPAAAFPAKHGAAQS